MGQQNQHNDQNYTPSNKHVVPNKRFQKIINVYTPLLGELEYIL